MWPAENRAWEGGGIRQSVHRPLASNSALWCTMDVPAGWHPLPAGGAHSGKGMIQEAPTTYPAPGAPKMVCVLPDPV
jgi:hypothetical protein